MSLPKDKRRLRGVMRRAARNRLSEVAAVLATGTPLAIHLSVVQEVGGGIKEWEGARDLDASMLALWRAEMRRLSKRVLRAPR